MMRAFVLLSIVLCGSAVADWPAWRGPDQSGASAENAPVTTWSLGGENLRWRSPVGGRTTPIVMGDRLFLIGPVGEGVGSREQIACLDASTGKTLWAFPFNVFHTDIVENRVGWTALAADPETGNLYAHGTGGEFFCLDRDGKLIWSRSLTEEFGRFSGFGGRLQTPVIDGDRVILGFLCSGWGEHARLGNRYVALNKRTGAVLWWTEPGGQPLDTIYSTPVFAEIGGQRQMIIANADGWVYGTDARDGSPLWKYRFSTRALNTTPVVSGNHVYVTHSEENPDTTVMGRVVCLDATQRGEIELGKECWRVDGLAVGYCSPSISGGRLYVIDNSALLVALDAATGAEKWRHSLGRVGKGSPLVTRDGVIYAPEQNGVFWILKDAGDRAEVLSQTQFPPVDEATDEFFGSPAISGGRVYFMTRYGAYCLGPATGAAPAAQSPTRPTTAAGAPGLHVEPADVTLAPGESVEFKLHYRGEGQDAAAPGEPPRFTLAGARGEITPAGVLTADAAAAFSAGSVQVQWGDLKATARVRVCPRPPFAYDFESLDPNATPPGWLNVIQKAVVTEADGNKFLRHLAERPTPAFMRLRTYMTPPIPGGYTIQADMLGKPKRTFKPDMGLVNSRYELILLGTEPALRVVTWPPLPRIQKDVPFDWQTDVWYRMKFEVRLEGGKALLRGKVWPRDGQEPSAWTIEAEDPFPNQTGSPGLYGYANNTTARSKGCEIYWDNVAVTPNE